MTREQPIGARLLFWVGQACRQAREAAEPEIKRSKVAGLLDRGQQVVEAFELGHNVPREFDYLLAVYGELLGRDPRELVSDALKLWYEHGTAPSVSPRDEVPEAERLPPVPPAPRLQGATSARPSRRRKAS